MTAQDLWKTITSVSNAGAKRGRAKRRGATKFKDLNMGQRIGQGNLIETFLCCYELFNRQNEYSMAWSKCTGCSRS